MQDTTPTTEAGFDLDPAEIRVLGVLIEKSFITPDAYPLSVNAITTGCNQLTAREPVMSLSETEVQDAVDRLIARRLVSEARPAKRTRGQVRAPGPPAPLAAARRAGGAGDPAAARRADRGRAAPALRAPAPLRRRRRGGCRARAPGREIPAPGRRAAARARHQGDPPRSPARRRCRGAGDGRGPVRRRRAAAGAGASGNSRTRSAVCARSSTRCAASSLSSASSSTEERPPSSAPRRPPGAHAARLTPRARALTPQRLCAHASRPHARSSAIRSDRTLPRPALGALVRAHVPGRLRALRRARPPARAASSRTGLGRAGHRRPAACTG